MRGGSIIVKDDQIISTGYIGAPRGIKDCMERGYCLRDKLRIPHGTQYEICRSVHCEANAIINAARAGVSLLGATMYTYEENGKTGEMVDSTPCYMCKKMMINAGLNRVIGNTKDGGLKIAHVEDWVAEWKTGDMLDDQYQYGKDQNIKENLMSADEVRNGANIKQKEPVLEEKDFKSIKEILVKEGRIQDINLN